MLALGESNYGGGCDDHEGLQRPYYKDSSGALPQITSNNGLSDSYRTLGKSCTIRNLK